jgi:P pilus assembly chaperone PapD
VKKRKIAHWCVMILIAGLLVVSQPASAGIVLNGTRFIYPAKSKEITVRLTNEGANPALVQVWVDDGDAKQTPENTQAPFEITPPVFRMDPKKSQVLRVRLSGTGLPTDRESLYWLNVLEVPPKPNVKDDENYMQLAFRYRLKLIHRPHGLPDSADAAAQHLKWTRRTSDKPDDIVVQAKNDSPYYVSLNSTKISVGDQSIEGPAITITPHSAAYLTFHGKLSGDPSAWTVDYQVINDWGAFVPVSRPLSH